jgi:ABC-2 type transport system ATP-binding protein
VIEVHNLSKRFKDFWAVKDLNFEVQPGEIFGFLGPNGAGKTTTIRMLTGQLKPTSGFIRVAGVNPSSEPKRFASQINMVCDEPNLYRLLSGHENLRFFQQLYGVPAQRVDEVLEMVGLTQAAKRAVEKYSNGMRQRLLVARALLNHPRVLFLDEPTRGLDPIAARHIRQIVLKLSQEGNTIFLTTQYVEEADELCHRVAFLNKGQFLAIDAPAVLKKKYSKAQPLVEISLASEDGSAVQSLTLDPKRPDDLQRLSEAWGQERLLAIHSQEATLEDVYIQLLGEGLAV